jgi:hypothetical protein
MGDRRWEIGDGEDTIYQHPATSNQKPATSTQPPILSHPLEGGLGVRELGMEDERLRMEDEG